MSSALKPIFVLESLANRLVFENLTNHLVVESLTNHPVVEGVLGTKHPRDWLPYMEDILSG